MQLTDKKHPEVYGKMMEIQGKLNNELEEILKQHNIKLEQMEDNLGGKPSESEGENEEDIKFSDVEDEI